MNSGPYRPVKIGDRVHVFGVLCVVYQLHAAGTVDVEATDGSDRCWRMSGGLVAIDRKGN